MYPLVSILISILIMLTGCGSIDEHDSSSDIADMNSSDAGISQTDHAASPSQNDGIAIDLEDGNDYYEYYLTKEELFADIEQGYIFNLDTAFTKKADTEFTEGTGYVAPYVSQGNWPFYVYEDNTINLEIAFSDLLTKPNKNIFPSVERVIVEVISPDEQSAYWFEKVGDEITEDTFIQEQISVTPGEWKLQISFAYVCGEAPAHLKIAAAYETPSEKDINWLKEERIKAQADERGEDSGTYVFNEESQISEIALFFSLRNISPTGVTLVFHQYDADAPKGDLMYEENYVVEVLKNGEWEEIPILMEENYGYSYIESESIVQSRIDWKYLYGELEPGEYRIGKRVVDSIETGNSGRYKVQVHFDEYEAYAHFVIN